MSKQDRQGVRTPADLERKYNLGGLETQTQQQSEKLSQLNQVFAQFQAETNAKIAELEEKTATPYPVGSIYVGVTDAEPSTLFGGKWELLAEGYLLIGKDQESGDLPAELQYLESCHVWKRIS